LEPGFFFLVNRAELFVSQEEFALHKPREAKCEDGCRLEPEEMGGPHGAFFDEVDDAEESAKADGREDDIATDGVDGVSLLLHWGRSNAGCCLGELEEAEEAEGDEEQGGGGVVDPANVALEVSAAAGWIGGEEGDA